MLPIDEAYSVENDQLDEELGYVKPEMGLHLRRRFYYGLASSYIIGLWITLLCVQAIYRGPGRDQAIFDVILLSAVCTLGHFSMIIFGAFFYHTQRGQSIFLRYSLGTGSFFLLLWVAIWVAMMIAALTLDSPSTSRTLYLIMIALCVGEALSCIVLANESREELIRLGIIDREAEAKDIKYGKVAELVRTYIRQ